MIDFNKELDNIEWFVNKVIDYCNSHIRVDTLSANSDLLINHLGTNKYSNILCNIDGEDIRLKRLAQKLFMCLGTPAYSLNNQIIDLAECIKYMEDIKNDIESIRSTGE